MNIGDYLKYRSLLVKSIKEPRHVWIEPTNNCNLDCKYCPRKKANRKLGFMEFNLFKKVIDEISTYKSTVTVTLHKDGEPLLHPNIIDMVRYAKSKNNIYCRFSTNAMLLNLDISRELVSAGLDSISISFDSDDKAGYENVRRYSSYNMVRNNILNFVELRNALKTKLPYIELVRVQSGELANGEKNKHDEYWASKVDKIELKPLLSWSSGLIDTGDVSKVKRYPCQNVWTSPSIMWNGDVCVCCLFIQTANSEKGVVGNIKCDSLSRIWGNGEIKYIRNVHLKGCYDEIPFCRDCRDWDDQWKRKYEKYWNIITKLDLKLLCR